MAFAEFMATTTLIKTLAQKILERGHAANLTMPTLEKVALGIGRLIEEKKFVLEFVDPDDASAVTDEFVNKFQNAIEQLQNKTARLLTTRILDLPTFNFLDLPCCGGKTPTTPSSILADAEDVVPDSKRKTKPKLRYHIQDLPNVTGDIEFDREIIDTAWKAWEDKLFLSVERVKRGDENRANIIIKKASLPGIKIADAHSGPPENQLLEVRFDDSEAWSKSKFLYAALHEFGHILGLNHSEVEGDIMYKKHQEDFFNSPDRQTSALLSTDNDIKIAQSIWGKK